MADQDSFPPLIMKQARLEGNVTLGNHCIVHSTARICAKEAPITIGPWCVFEEGSVIINSSEKPLTIGQDNLFRVGCSVESPTSIGDCNLFEPHSKVYAGVTVGNNCCIAVNAIVPQGTNVVDSSSVVGQDGSIKHRAIVKGGIALERVRHRDFCTALAKAITTNSDP